MGSPNTLKLQEQVGGYGSFKISSRHSFHNLQQPSYSPKDCAGFLTGSISILAEAIHSLLDLIVTVITLFGVRVADKPSNR
jgi:hypothetical protein